MWRRPRTPLRPQAGTADTDSGTSSGESDFGSDVESSTDIATSPSLSVPTPTDASGSPTSSHSSSPSPCPPPNASGDALSLHHSAAGLSASAAAAAVMSPPPTSSHLSHNQGLSGSGTPTMVAAGSSAPSGNSSGKPGGGGKNGSAKRKRKPSDDSKRPFVKKKGSAGGTPADSANGATLVQSEAVSAGVSRPNFAGHEATGMGSAMTPPAMPIPASASGALGVTSGLPAWRLALKRPREELTPKERALDKVATYMDKFGDAFLRPSQRKALAAAREKEKVTKTAKLFFVLLRRYLCGCIYPIAF